MPVGIVSTEPGMLLGKRRDFPKNLAQIQVALVGRVPLHVTQENGKIEIGDLIAPSLQIPGFGMRASETSENPFLVSRFQLQKITKTRLK